MEVQEKFLNAVLRQQAEKAQQEAALENQLHVVSRYALYAKSLIIDSRVSSRKKIKDDLEKFNLFETAQEATSLQNGIDALRQENWDACIIGPSLSIEGVQQVVAAGRKNVKSLDCAFIAVVKNSSIEVEKSLQEAGIHSIIESNYTQKSFSNIVTKAINKAHAEPIEREVVTAEIHDVLADSAHRLRAIAKTVEEKKVGIDNEGNISNQLAEVLSSVIENMFPEIESTDESDKKFFSSALVEWFSKRTKASHKDATEALRKKLIAQFYRQQSIDFAQKTSHSMEVLNVKAA